MTVVAVEHPFNGPDGRFLPGNAASKGSSPARFDIQALLVAEAAKRPQIVSKLLDMAEHGDFRAIEYTIDRLAGKPVQRSIDVTVTAQWSELVAGIQGDLAAMLQGQAAQLQPTLPDVVDGQLADPPTDTGPATPAV
jgi:hypothetical protein